jgi:hypothetical protein
VVKKHADNVLTVTAMVLANLCVSYIMTSQVSQTHLPKPGTWYLGANPLHLHEV